jgi:hypothetical protein
MARYLRTVDLETTSALADLVVGAGRRRRGWEVWRRREASGREEPLGSLAARRVAASTMPHRWGLRRVDRDDSSLIPTGMKTHTVACSCRDQNLFAV